MMRKHARLSPSAADRWMVCTASVEMIERMEAEGLADDEPGEAASEGTVAHRIRELCLKFGLDTDSFIGRTMSADGRNFVVDEDMADFVQTGVDFVREFTDAPLVEVRVDLGSWLPEQFGTCDTAWLTLNSSVSRLTISDLKYGQGVAVDPVIARQPRIYALGAWHHMGRPDVEEVELIIDQPRLGGIKGHMMTMKELLAFGEELKSVYAKIASGDTEFVPGEKQCKWCPAAQVEGRCPARDQWLMSMFEGAFDDLDAEEPTFVDPDEIDPARRYYIVQHAKLAAAWLAELHQRSLDSALDGKPDPGSKAVIGQRGDRFLKEPDRAERILTMLYGDEAYVPRKLIGITEMQKRLKPGRTKPGVPAAWRMIEAMVDQAPGKPILVSETDLRPALRPYAEEFDDLE